MESSLERASGGNSNGERFGETALKSGPKSQRAEHNGSLKARCGADIRGTAEKWGVNVLDS